MTEFLLTATRLAVEPMRWFGEHVVIPNALAIVCGCVAGVVWFKLDRDKGN